MSDDEKSACHELAINIDDVRTAAARIAPFVRHTQLISAPRLDRELGMTLLFKPECLQITGSFKFRGASNRLEALSPEERGRGVIAYSSGNHAQGIAAAAHARDMSATIIMPADAPEMKKRATSSWGAEVIEYDRFGEDRAAIGMTLATKTGATLVPPYDDPLVMAGQGTAGLEVAEDLVNRGITPDAAICCCGGGGLSAGFSTAMKATFAQCAIYAAEPSDFDDTARSLTSGTRETVDPAARSICDAIVTPQPGELTFPVNSQMLAGGLTADDTTVRLAMAMAFEHLKLVVEPGGAIALAALLANREQFSGKTVVVMLSGGNVDPTEFIQAIQPAD